MSQATTKSTALYAAAKQGDLAAGRELIAACRDGMLAPEWDAPSRPSDDEVRAHVERRKRAAR
jgi:hypothetical protein